MTPLSFARLFDEFRAATWSGWRTILARVTPATRELVVCAGRGSGKSRIAALLAACYAAHEYRSRAPGERIFVAVVAPDRRQSRVTFDYLRALFRARPELEALIEREVRERLDLVNGVTVEVVTANLVAPRGRSYGLVVIEEAAFLPQDGSASPDVELRRAILPALARVPGSLLVVVGSPYARRGILWQAAQRAATGGDSSLVYVQAPTLKLNPGFDQAAVEKALAEDPSGAAAEYLAEFRRDIESFVSREAVEACTVEGRRELPPTAGLSYSAFVDPSGGSADSFTLAIGHAETRGGQPGAVVDCFRERRPPFSPEAVVSEFAALLKSYRVPTVTGDRYAGEWPREAFRRHGITYEPAAKPKSDLYRDALALLNAGRLELPDDSRLHAQLVGLERRTARGGKDSVDHAPGAHDDLANVVCGLAVGLAVDAQPVSLVWGRKHRRRTLFTSKTSKPNEVWSTQVLADGAVKCRTRDEVIASARETARTFPILTQR